MLNDKVKAGRKAAQSWLGILVYDSARGQVDRGVFTERLQATIDPLLKLTNIRDITASSLPTANLAESGAAIKKRMRKVLTPEKYQERISVLSEMLVDTTSSEKVEASGSSTTFLAITTGWARITGQDQEYIWRVTEKLQRYYEKWQKETGYRDFSDSEVTQHPQEYGNFLAGLSRILLEETPDRDISKAGELFREAIRKASEDDFNNTVQKAIKPAAAFITQKTETQLISAFIANPEARNKITAPEVEALVEWEKAKQGWDGNTDKAFELLRAGLNPELQSTENQPDRAVIISALKSIGRRNLLSNILDALDEKLKARFITYVTNTMKRLYHQVKSIWEFLGSTSANDDHRAVSQWLFRR